MTRTADKLWKEKLYLAGKPLSDERLDELFNDAESGKWTEHKSFMKRLNRKIENAKQQPDLTNF